MRPEMRKLRIRDVIRRATDRGYIPFIAAKSFMHDLGDGWIIVDVNSKWYPRSRIPSVNEQRAIARRMDDHPPASGCSCSPPTA